MPHENLNVANIKINTTNNTKFKDASKRSATGGTGNQNNSSQAMQTVTMSQANLPEKEASIKSKYRTITAVVDQSMTAPSEYGQDVFKKNSDFD